MANYANLKATINANIKANGAEEITGPILNNVLNAAVNALGAGWQYMGVATPATSPGTPDANVFYIASTAGTYTNFGGLAVADGEVAILKYNGSWSKEVTGAATAAQVTQLGQKVDELAQGKFYGYFSDADELPAGDVPGFAYVGTAAPFAIYNFDGSDWSDSGLTIDEIPIGNGDDIDTDADGKLQFANRVYNALQPNGMGYKILRKDATFASQVTDANTIYEIRYPFDLDGASVTIPAGCALKFDGGSLDNGTINGQETKLMGCLLGFIGASLNISGSWLVDRITSDALIVPSDTDALKKINALCNSNYYNEVIIGQGEFTVAALEDNFPAGLRLRSNTKYEVNGDIKLSASDKAYASVLQVYNAKNIQITGSGKIIGDRDTHSGTSGEWGHGIAIYSGENILVEGVSISKCWGDGIYVGSSAAASPKSQYIRIINCTISETRRQGISFGNTAFAEVDGCYIYNVSGTSPESGIDIETDVSGAVNENISIRNSVIYNCVKGLLVVDLVGGSSIKNISIENCKISSTTNVAMQIKCDESPSIVNCDINTASGQDIIEASTAAEVILLRCNLKGNNATHAITNGSTSILKIDECSISGAEYLSTYFYKGRIADSTIDTTKFRQYGTTSSATIKDSTISFVPSGTLKNTIIENCRMSAGALVAFDGGFSVRLVNNKITTTANISYMFYLSGSTPGFVQFDGNIIEHTGFNITNYLYQGTGHTIQFNGNVALDSGVYTTLSI